VDDAPKPTMILIGPDGRSSARTFWGANRDPKDKMQSVKKTIPLGTGSLPEVPLAILTLLSSPQSDRGGRVMLYEIVS
jgi:hypothetical protein